MDDKCANMGGMVEELVDPVAIGERIRVARVRAGITQDKLANAIGKSTRQVQHYEAGTAKPYAVLREIGVATGVSATWLLSGGEDVAAAEQHVLLRLAAMEKRDEEMRSFLETQMTELRAELQALSELLDKTRRVSSA